MTILVFDLDDTLYDELTFVQSGFRAVAEYLENSFGLKREETVDWMLERLRTHGRGKIFNDLLNEKNIYTSSLSKKCVSIYRTHKPNIKLYSEAEELFNRLTTIPIYIVTDGNKLVQHNKLVALGLYEKAKRCFITHRFGLKYAKPSPYCFLKIIENERVKPNQVIYVGDNPNKDFVGIKPLGFKTIRIMQGQYKDLEKSKEFEADIRIKSLSELNQSLIQQLTT